MNYLNIITNILDTNQWLQSLANHLTDVLTKSGLLISEDITLIQTLIGSQLDFNANNDCLHSKHNYINKQVLIVISLTTGSLWFGSSLTSYRSLFGSIIFGTISWKLSTLLYKLFNKIYLKHRLIQRTTVLSERLTKDSVLMRKYFKLIEDNEVIENNGKHSARICEMKDRLRSVCWKWFIRFRELTIDLRLKYPLNTEIDEEMNFLCCFPIDSFEKFINEDKSVMSLSLLKSLIQLKRLQMSEFLRRIICLFLTICLDRKQTIIKTNDNYMQNVCKEVLKIFDSLIEESDENYPELLSQYNCGKSLWISSEESLIKSRDLRQTNQTIETINILNTNRSLRKHLLTALNILDDCDSLIEDGIHCTDIRCKVRHKLDSMSTEFNSFNNLFINLEKLLRIEELKESKAKPFNTNELTKEEQVVKPLTHFEDYVVRDQVFEAIVTEDCHQMDVDLSAEDDELWEYRLKLAQESDASNNLFRELKVALKSKAVEHKRREAKAQGVEWDETEVTENISEENSELREGIEQSLEPLNQKSVCNTNETTNSMKAKNFYETEVKENANNYQINTSNAFGFESQIACIAAEKGRLFGLSQQTESFGDDSDTEEECEDQ